MATPQVTNHKAVPHVTNHKAVPHVTNHKAVPQGTNQKAVAQWPGTGPGGQILVYALKPKLLPQFAAFYQGTIKPWLQARKVTGHAMVVGNTLFAVVSSNNPPWTGTDGIPNFAQFVASKAPVIKPLPDVL